VTLAVVAVLPQPRTPRANSLHRVQYAGSQDIGVGKLLVAKPELGDPHFAQTVVLIVHYDDDKGAVGIVLNRRTNVPLTKVFPEIKGATQDPVFEGGPVDTGAAQALVRSKNKLDKASRVFGDVYTSGEKDVIEHAVSSAKAPSAFRLYVGYAGWSPGQLEREIEIGGWSVLRGTPEIAFDDDPDSLWERLQRKTETRIAGLPAPAFRLYMPRCYPRIS
jgi:putative transcriptional regulator